ncbi:hypothetical protein CHELA40_10014 [Chelatococcus asaccharovorans]|nr:hypothetical protein CHELA40_10014 [Chelatococcus asaccharovorans]CAH1687875.1 hypothetical protein CHELA17_65594 [Chelatococcus asaccharovorans]
MERYQHLWIFNALLMPHSPVGKALRARLVLRMGHGPAFPVTGWPPESVAAHRSPRRWRER